MPFLLVLFLIFKYFICMFSLVNDNYIFKIWIATSRRNFMLIIFFRFLSVPNSLTFPVDTIGKIFATEPLRFGIKPHSSKWSKMLRKKWWYFQGKFHIMQKSITDNFWCGVPAYIFLEIYLVLPRLANWTKNNVVEIFVILELL